jgi:DNA polymerase I-like protein with 3'-5' exonuclease and polymerase domains
MRLLFDAETNGLPRKGMDRLHCLVVKDLDTQEVFRFNDTGNGRSITEGVNLLAEAKLLVGHNIVYFDIPVIKGLYPFFEYSGDVLDTLILSRLFYPDILNRDFRKRPIGMPPKLYGRHSLEAWGYRLGHYKGEFAKTTDWAEWSQDMEDYCVQDTAVTSSLLDVFEPRIKKYGKCIQLEHECGRIMAQQETLGWPFDVTAAERLEGELRKESDQLADAMRATFPYVAGKEVVAKRNHSGYGYVKDAAFTKLTEFNPTSRDHIAWAFKTWRDWQPEEFTDTGRAKIDESVLLALGTDESRTFARLLELQKAIGQLSEGQNAWLKQVTKEGRIHHVCQLATNTGRNAHSRPNLGQVSSDPRCRALFLPPTGMTMVGADASGLELRMLGHYLAYFDGGRFSDIVVNGDIHQINADAVGVTRKAVKSITYAFIYGAGDEKLGTTTDPSLKGDKAKRLGKEIRRKFTEAIPGLDSLLKAVSKKAEGDVLKGLDGRPIRLQGKKHAALNYLLQSAGAIVCKSWVVETHHCIANEGLLLGIDYQPLAFIHDEQQLAVSPPHVPLIENILVNTMPSVGEDLQLKVPLAAEAKKGQSWADCH